MCSRWRAIGYAVGRDGKTCLHAWEYNRTLFGLADPFWYTRPILVPLRQQVGSCPRGGGTTPTRHISPRTTRELSLETSDRGSLEEHAEYRNGYWSCIDVG